MTAEVLALPHTYMIFKLGSHEYGFEARFLWETAVSASFTEVPRNEKHLIGVIQLHGKIIPVLDLARLLGISGAFPGGGLITVNFPDNSDLLAGFIVDLVVGFAKFPASEIQLLENGPDIPDIPFIKGWVGEGKQIQLLDMEKLIRDQIAGGPGAVGPQQNEN